MLIALIRSVPHAKVENLIISEDGFYETQVHVDMAEARASGDPKGFVQKEVATHLAGCIKSTGLPKGEGLWQIAFSQWAQTNLNLPAGFIA